MTATRQLHWHISPEFTSILQDAGLDQTDSLEHGSADAVHRDRSWQAVRLQLAARGENRKFWLLSRRPSAARDWLRRLWMPAGRPEKVLKVLEPLGLDLPIVAGTAKSASHDSAAAEQVLLECDVGPDIVEQINSLAGWIRRRRLALQTLGRMLGEIHRTQVRLSRRGLADLGLRWKQTQTSKPTPTVTVRQIVGWRRSGSKSGRLADLAQAVRQLQQCRLSGSEWMLLGQAYIGAVPTDRVRRKQTLRMVLDRIRRYLLGAQPQDFAAAGEFSRVGPAWVNRDYMNLMAQLHLRNLKDAMTAQIGEPLDKPGLASWRRRSRVRLQGLLGQERTIYLKRFSLPPAAEQIRRILSGHPRHSTAWIEWRNIMLLRAVGVPTMRTVAFAEKMRGVWELGSLLATEQTPGESLERWLPVRWESWCAKFGTRWRRDFVTRLAGLVRRLHAAHLCHRDLYTSHVFVLADDDGSVQFSLIDLQRMFAPKFARRRWRVKDLAALAATAELVSRTDRLRFLLTYLRRTGLDAQVKRWWRDIERKADRMMRHHRARMRRLARADGERNGR